jgi:glycosyltransferase involved in cell wall biosynthesis
MRIAFVVGDFPEVSETFISRKVDFLRANGHEVIVFRTQPRPFSPNTGRAGEQLCLEDLGPRKKGRVRSLFFHVKGLASLPLGGGSAGLVRRAYRVNALLRVPNYRRLAKSKPDLLHIHFAQNLAPIIGAGRVLKIPVVISVLGKGEFDWLDLNRISQEADVLVASSGYLISEFRKKIGKESAIELLPPEVPCSTFHFDRSYANDERVRILTVARLNWRKGLLYALHAALELKLRGLDFTWDIVGGGFEYKQLLETLNDLKLQDCVTLHGAKQPDELPRFYRRADVFVLPTLLEAFGVVLLEAQAAGIPVVSTNLGGIPEAVRNLESAILVPPRDYPALADALERLIRDPELRRRMGEAGRQYAQQFDIPVLGKRLLQIYEKAFELRHQKQEPRLSETAAGSLERLQNSPSKEVP